ncbi:phosphate acetyltransferase [Candidatus Woesearchaeota archaeon]|nr:phosphate acetyltransferase [Candidatus Woesearchaeota archaeon]
MDKGFWNSLLGKRGFLDSVVRRAVEINADSSRKIVFADTTDVILKAASLVKKNRIAHPLILGDSQKLESSFRRLGLSNLDEENVIDYLLPENKDKLDSYVNEYLEMRKKDGKPVSGQDALQRMQMPHYYAAMMVHKGLAHGFISGATSATKPYHPVFEIIKLAPGVNKTSGVFLMAPPKGDEVYFFADCVMNISPNSEQLAEIAMLTAKTASSFGLEPRVAMLSFSTRDSAKHESIERVKLATAMVKRKYPDMMVDGEIQVDSALVPEVMKRKCPDSPLKGRANVLIFPDLNAGNIGYKLVERLGHYEAVGPFLQGTRKAANDLSRGCSAEDVMYVAAVTVLQSKAYEVHDEDAQGKVIEPEVTPVYSRKAGSEEQKGSSGPGAGKEGKEGNGGNGVASKPDYLFKPSDDPLDRLPSNVRKIIEDGMNGRSGKKPGEKPD